MTTSPSCNNHLPDFYSMHSDNATTVAVLPLLQASGRPSIESVLASTSNLIHAIVQQASEQDEPVDEKHQEEQVDEQTVDKQDQDGSSSFTYTAPQSATETENQPPDPCFITVPWRISNRYYEADVRIRGFRPEFIHHPRLAERLEGVPAYIAIVNTGMNRHQHSLTIAKLQRLNADDEAEITLVVAIPAVAGKEEVAVKRSDKVTREESIAMYAEQGWEFLQLDDGLLDDDSDGDEEEGKDESDGDQPEQEDNKGLERIREALMNHMWAGMKRKPETTTVRIQPMSSSLLPSTEIHGTVQQPLPVTGAGFSDSIPLKDDSDNEEKEIHPSQLQHQQPKQQHENGSSSQDGWLASLGMTSHVQPNSLDEALARSFLTSTNLPDSDNPTTSLPLDPKTIDELERFLESQDPSWPPINDNVNTQTEGFADDFSDFVSGFPTSTITEETTTTEDEPESDLLPTQEEITLMRHNLFGIASEWPSEENNSPKPESVDLDLANQFSALQVHADRVRNISDPEQRRKQAALVALAFSMQWNDDGRFEL